VPEAVLHEDRQILGIVREGNSQWGNLKWAGIGGIEAANERFERQPPPERLAKIVGDLFFERHHYESTE
jgi:hypothetical protein